MTYQDDDTPRALTPAERRRMEAELARLEAELPGLAAAEDAARVAWEAPAYLDPAALRAYRQAERDYADVRAEIAALRERLDEDEQRAIERTHGPEVRR